MNLLKFYAYLFYRSKSEYATWRAVLSFNSLIIIQILSIISLIKQGMHGSESKSFIFQFTTDLQNLTFTERTLRILPVFIISYIFSVVYKHRLAGYYLEFSLENETQKKKRDELRKFYLFITMALLLISLILHSAQIS